MVCELYPQGRGYGSYFFLSRPDGKPTRGSSIRLYDPRGLNKNTGSSQGQLKIAGQWGVTTVVMAMVKDLLPEDEM